MNRNQIIADIKAMTSYGDKVFVSESDNQLLAMRSRIHSAIIRYRQEIEEYYESHPSEIPISKEELYSLNYNELADLRKRLNIGKKKVTSSVPAGDIASKARDVLRSKSTSEVARDIIVSQEQYEQEMFLTRDEIQQMGYEDYSRDELMQLGIFPLDYEEESHLKK